MNRALLFPYGYPVEIASSDTGAVEAAKACWGESTQLFEEPPLQLVIEVRDAATLPAVPEIAMQGSTCMLSSPYGAAAFCARTFCGQASLARSEMRDLEWFAYFWLHAWVLTALDMVFFDPLHAGCVARGDRGLLLCGESGSGKSTVALACGLAGWTVVAEDGVRIAEQGAELVVIGGRTSFQVRESARELFSGLEAMPVTTMPSGKRALLVPAQQAGVKTAQSVSPHKTIFLQRWAGPCRLSEFPRQAALEYCLANVKNPERRISEQRFQRLLSGGCLRLEYAEAADALRLLETLL